MFVTGTTSVAGSVSIDMLHTKGFLHDINSGPGAKRRSVPSHCVLDLRHRRLTRTLRCRDNGAAGVASQRGRRSSPSGIPTIRDRVVQKCCGAGLGAHLRGRSAAGAVRLPDRTTRTMRSVRSNSSSIKATREVTAADLSGYFDGIPTRRTDEVGGPSGQRPASAASAQDVLSRRSRKPTSTDGCSEHATRTGRGRSRSRRQACWLANLYMRRFVLGWKHATLEAHIVNYADDFVICCKPGKAEEAMTVMREMMERLRLTVKKTRHAQPSRRSRSPFLGFSARNIPGGRAECM